MRNEGAPGGTPAEGSAAGSAIDVALARFEHASAALSAVARARRPDVPEDAGPGTGPTAAEVAAARAEVRERDAEPPTDGESVWQETTTLDIDTRGAELWAATDHARPFPRDAQATTPATLQMTLPMSLPMPLDSPMAPARFSRVDMPVATASARPPRAPRRAVQAGVALVVLGIAGSVGTLALKRRPPLPVAAAPVRDPTLAPTPAPLAVQPVPAPTSVETAASAIDAAPTAAGPVAADPPQVVAPHPLPARHAAPGRVASGVSAAASAAQQKADSFLRDVGSQREETAR